MRYVYYIFAIILIFRKSSRNYASILADLALGVPRALWILSHEVLPMGAESWEMKQRALLRLVTPDQISVNHVLQDGCGIFGGFDLREADKEPEKTLGAAF